MVVGDDVHVKEELRRVRRYILHQVPAVPLTLLHQDYFFSGQSTKAISPPLGLEVKRMATNKNKQKKFLSGQPLIPSPLS